MWGWQMMDGRMGGWMIVGMLFWAAILAGLVLLAVWAFRRTGVRAPRDGETALDVLRKRYARGEISREEFESIRKDIS